VFISHTRGDEDGEYLKEALKKTPQKRSMCNYRRGNGFKACGPNTIGMLYLMK
jgi:hypothetical protein